MKDKHNIRAPAFYYELEAQDNDHFESDDGPWTISGIAVGEDSILRTDDGTPVLFSGEVLEAAADTQSDKPLSVDHPTDDDGQPIFPPPSDETVGRVTKATYKPGKGLVYEATTHDPDIAKGIQAGTYEVSVHPVWKGFSGRDEATGAYVPEDTVFLDLSVVSQGMDRANEARIGPSTELLAWARAADFSAELEASADGVGDVDDPEGLVSSAVRGTLRAFGFTPDDAGEGIDTETMAAESAAEDGSSTQPMQDDKRQQYVSFLTANADFDEESLEAMDDDVLETTHQIVAEAAADSGDGDSTTETSGADPGDDPDDDTDGPTLGEMTIDDLANGLQERGFVTEDNAPDLVQEAQAQATKKEQVDEIIAKSDDFDEDDRQDLLASAESVIDREHSRVRREQAASLPGTAGAAGTLTASAGSNDDLDEYGTGVEGEN